MPAKERGIYIPHMTVIRENAATTKMRIVYDASARAKDTAPPLNECLETDGPYKTRFGECWSAEDFM